MYIDFSIDFGLSHTLGDRYQPPPWVWCAKKAKRYKVLLWAEPVANEDMFSSSRARLKGPDLG